MSGSLHKRIRPEAVIAGVLVLCLVAWAVKPERDARARGPLAFLEPDVDVGERYTGEPIFVEYTFTNRSPEPVTVSDEACCGLRTQWPDGRTVEPGRSARVRLEYTGPAGEIGHAIPIMTEGGDQSVIAIRGRALRGVHLHPDHPAAVLEPGGPPHKVDIRLHTDDEIPFRILDAEAPDEVRIEPYSEEETVDHRLSLSVYPAQLGARTVAISFRTSHPQAEMFTVPILVRTQGEIAVAPDRFFVHPESNEAIVRVFSRSGEPFELRVADNPEVTSVTERTRDHTVHIVTLRLDEDLAAEPTARLVALELPEGRIALPVVPLKDE